METTRNCRQTRASTADAPGAHRPGTERRWTQFLAGVLAILLFAFGVIPGLQRLGPIREVRDAIQRSGIDATALFYTESDVSSEAEASIRNAIRHAPRDANRPRRTPLRQD